MLSDREMNSAARMLPYESTLYEDDPDLYPAIDIHGVQVYAYVKDGRLRVSLHFDGDTDVWDGGTVPVDIDLGGDGFVFSAD